MNQIIRDSLRMENRNHILEILTLHPSDPTGTQTIHYTNGSSTSAATNISTTTAAFDSKNPVKQRLVFGNHTIRTLLLRHVLSESTSLLDKGSSTTAKRLPSSSSSSSTTSLTKEEESWRIHPKNPWGIVTTRRLTQSVFHC